MDPYFEHFLKNGYELHILHFDSLTPHLTTGSVPSFEYEMTDIFRMGISELITKIRKISPVGIISINFLSVMDLFVNRLGYKLSIPVLYMEHGLILEQAAGKYIRSGNKFKSTNRLVRYTGKYLSLCLQSKQFFREMNLLIKTQIRKDFSASAYNAYLFYAKNGYRILDKRFKIHQDSVYFSGYPISSHNFNEIKECQANQVLYIHQPFVLAKITKNSYDDECEYLNSLNKIFLKFGLILKIKLHPAEKIDRYKNCIPEIISDGNLLDHIFNSKIIIGHYSTALFTAIVLKKSIIILKYPGLIENFSDIFIPISKKIDSYQELTNYLKDNINLSPNINTYDKFIENYIGTENNYFSRTEAIIKILKNYNS